MLHVWEENSLPLSSRSSKSCVRGRPYMFQYVVVPNPTIVLRTVYCAFRTSVRRHRCTTDHSAEKDLVVSSISQKREEQNHTQVRFVNIKMFNPKAHLPQYGYFRASYSIPGTDWQITGHSRSMERTGFWIPQLSVVLDAGVDLPPGAGCLPKAILVTHGHSDHCHALPMLMRHCTSEDSPTSVLAPAPIIHRLRSFVQLSFAVKVDIEDELPIEYAPPHDSESSPEPGSILRPEGDLLCRAIWRPCDATTSMTLGVGKKAKTPLAVQCLQLFHRRCSTVGYRLAVPSQIVKKVRPDLVGSTKQETGQNVQAARARGEAFQIQVVEPEQPKFAFVLDTQIEALMEDESSTAAQILECPVVMIECTYLEESFLQEARKRAHVCWCELLPFVAQSVQRRKEEGVFKTWILVHFSLRYLDPQIVEFFETEEASRITLEQAPTTEEGQQRPADVVLWLDDGPKELFIDSVRL